jgi:molybdate transport system substrate-binding protein
LDDGSSRAGAANAGGWYGDEKARRRLRPDPPVKTEMAVAAALTFAATTVQAATTDLVVHCDPPLARPLYDIAVAFRSRNGVQLRIFPTAPNAIPAQLAREIQNDVVVTQPEILARICASGQLADLPLSSQWRNRLIVAAKRAGSRKPIEQETLAAPDPVWGGGPDGPALLTAAGLRPARLAGTFSTDEARTLLLDGEAAYALLYATELTPELEEVATSRLSAPRIAVAAVTRSARRPNPDALLRFLATAEAGAILRANALEPMS